MSQSCVILKETVGSCIRFCLFSGCDQLVNVPTHTSGNCFDLLLTDVHGVVDHVISYIVSSDHCTVSFNLKLSFKIPDVGFSRRIFLKNLSN